MTLPLTGFELTGDVTTVAQEDAYLAAVLANGSPRIAIDVVGRSTIHGLPVRVVRIGGSSVPTWEELRTKGCILFQAGVHGRPEESGREAMLMRLRDWAYTTDPEVIAYLTAHPVVIIPTINPEGTLLNQGDSGTGPLNRDYVTITQPEVKAVWRVIQMAQPLIVADSHDGGTPIIEVSPPNSPETPAAITAASSDLIDNYIFPLLQADGFATGYYDGGTGTDRARNAISLSHRLSIVIEPDGYGRARHIDSQLLVFDGIVAYHKANETTLPALIEQSKLDEAQKGRDRAAYGALSPVPAGYQLSAAAHEASEFQRQAFGIASYPRNGGFYVPMGQQARPAIPQIWTSSSLRVATAPTSDSDISAVSDMSTWSTTAPEPVEPVWLDGDPAGMADGHTWELEAAAGSPDLLAVPLVASAAQVFAPTVAPGSVTVAVGTIPSSAAVYAPAITAGVPASTLAPGFLASTAAAFAPTVVSGIPPVVVSPPVLASAAATFAPVIGSGAAIGAPIVSSSAAVFAATILPGSLVLLPPFVGSSAEVFSPSVYVPAAPFSAILTVRALATPSLTVTDA